MPHFAVSLPSRLARVVIAFGILLSFAGVVMAQTPLPIPGVPTIVGNIAVVAGTQTAGYGGDGSLATATGVKMSSPFGLVFDSSGNLYIGEGGTSAATAFVRVVNAQTGIISTYAGTATGGLTVAPPPGTLATKVALGSGTMAVAIDSSNNLYIGDSVHSVVEKVNVQDGTISVFAGTFGAGGYTGDSGPATSAKVGSVDGLLVDRSGNIYITDQTTKVVRVVYGGGAIPAALNNITPTPVAGNIYTIAGSTTACAAASYPCGDGGPASNARFTLPVGMAVDAFNNLYFGDASVEVARVIYQGGTTAACLIQIENPTLFGLPSGATSCSGATSTPQQGNIYTIAGTYGKSCATAPCGNGGPATSATLGTVYGAAVDPSGNVFIVDEGAANVRRVDAITGTLTTIAGKVKSSGFTGIPGVATAATMKAPYGVAFDSFGNLFIADGTGNDVYAVAGAGQLPLQAQTITFNPLSAVTYGASAITLTATVSSGLTVTFSVVSGPATVSGSTLTITGAGPVVVEADQAGNSTYSAATAVQQTLTVNPAVLTVTADNQTIAQGAALPSFTYTVTGLVSPDTTSAAVTGNPTLGTTATSSSPAATYPITIMQGTLQPTANYTFGAGSFINGTLTIVAKTTQTIAFNPIPNVIYGSTTMIDLNTYASTDAASLSLTYTTGNTNVSISGHILTIIGAGTVMVTASQSGDATHMAATSVTQMFTVNQAALTVKADSLSRPFGQPNPTLTYTIMGFVNGDTQATAATGSIVLTTTATSTSPLATYPITFAPATTFSAPNYAVTYQPGQLTVTGNVAQTIMFTQALPTVSYGGGQIALTATASSTLPITYSVTGPATVSGSTLTITGVGTVNVTANQAGDANYAGATAVARSFMVSPAVLTFTATILSSTVGSPIPPLTYTVMGFVNGDTQATATTGAPMISTTATSGSGVGPYPITITRNTLAATNYTFSFVNGTLNIINKTAQTITFGALPNVTFGAPRITLGATASSGIPVTYSVLGPATVSGSLLTITGAGTVTVTANQAGDTMYSAATPVSQVFTVAPASLTVTANNLTRVFGAANPTFTYTITGFVNGDAQATATSGTPALSTTATTTSPAGQYPITIGAGTLAAQNYTFVFVNANLTVTTSAQTITFGVLRNTTYGSTVALSATASSGLPITYSVAGNAAISGSTLTVTGLGPISVTASQTGNSSYAAATPLTQTFTATQAVLTVTVGYYTRPQGAVNPTFTATISGFVNGDANTPLVLTGVPIITTLATPASAPGTYAITPALGTLFSSNYTFAFVPGQLVVTQAPNYIITANPNALTIPLGQSGQTTLSVASVNSYAGSVTFSCGQVPIGLTCNFSPATVTVTIPPNGGNVTNISTLTVTTTGPSAQLRTGSGNTVMAGLFLLPGGLAGLLLAFRRKRIVKNARFRQLLTLIVLLSGVMGMGACGSSNNLGQAPMGNTTLLITATGTGTANTGSQNATNILYLTVNVVPLQQ